MKWRNFARLSAAGGTAVAAYIGLVRPRLLRWGATEEEFRESLPGDELIPYPRHHDTHAITIHAPVSIVWAYLLQIGQGRGGFYSYACLENLIGCQIHNVQTIVPELQTLKVGDLVRLHPEAPPMIAMLVDPSRGLVFAGQEVPGLSPPTCSATWAFCLRKIDAGSTRLLVRSRWYWKPDFVSWLGCRCFLEPAHFIMERKMMLTVRALAERDDSRSGSINCS